MLRTSRLPLGSARIALGALIVGLSVAVGGARAAEVASGSFGECTFRLAGPIRPGDRDRLAKAAAAAPDLDRVLCLDSLGGDWPEALLLMDLIGADHDGGFWATVVNKGARCEGECAFVFMAGRYTEHHDVNGPRRRLHVDGRLQFRLPSPPVVDGPQSAAAIVAAYQRAVDAFAGLVGREKAAHLGPLSVLPRTLLLALGGAPDRPLDIDTVQHAGQLGIDLMGVGPVKRLTRAMVRQACLNVAHWSKGRASTALAARSAQDDTAIDAATHESQFPDPVEPEKTCYAASYRNRGGEFFLKISPGEGSKRPIYNTAKGLRESVGQGDGIRNEAVGFATNTAGWAVHPPETRLEQLR